MSLFLNPFEVAKIKQQVYYKDNNDITNKFNNNNIINHPKKINNNKIN